ncbi:MAG: hypothetical protein ACSHYF_03770 [Verrucomicrobiaceae bacterium]
MVPDDSPSESEWNAPRSSKEGNKIASRVIIGGLAVLTLVGIISLITGNDPSHDRNARQPEDPFAVKGWQKVAYETLAAFLKAESPEEQAPYVLAADEMIELLRKSGPGNEPLSADLFGPAPLPLAMRKEGLFGLIYERPGYSGLIYLQRPIVDREVELGLKSPAAWDAFARHVAYENIPPRGRVTAFFRREGDLLFLDAEMFIQSRDDLLRKFASERHADEQTFRVILSPAHPEVAKLLAEEYDLPGPWFWVEDPSFESLRHPVAIPDGAGKTLLDHPWEPANLSAPKQGATIKLQWHPVKDALILSDWICWNFHRLPGERPN